MLRTVRVPPGKGRQRSTGVWRGNSRPSARQRRLTRALFGLLGIDQPTSSAGTVLTIAAGLLLFAVVTMAFYAAIRRHDVELSLEQRLTYGKHVQMYGNRTVYIVDPGNVDNVFSELSHDEWTKISSKVDFVAFLYDATMYPSSEDFEILHDALESVNPHGYGVSMYPCGCLIHNVLLQHVSVRFDGMECAMLPGLVLETAAVKWVNTTVQGDACKDKRDRLFVTPWYHTHSWKLQSARDEYAKLRTHLSMQDHPDRPLVDDRGPSVSLSGMRKSPM